MLYVGFIRGAISPRFFAHFYRCRHKKSPGA